MTCERKEGGCGHQFCWLCLKPCAGYDHYKLPATHPRGCTAPRNGKGYHHMWTKANREDDVVVDSTPAHWQAGVTLVEVNYQGKGTWVPARYEGRILKGRHGYIRVRHMYGGTPGKVFGAKRVHVRNPSG